ncbi:MAG: glycosyltransferase family 4 protein, partial [Bacteroidota bacterium]
MYNSIDIKTIGRNAKRVNREKVKKKLNIPRRPVVGIVARLRSEKGHSLLLHAMKIVIQSMPRTTLVIIGDGPDKSMLEALGETLHITENIRWLGSIPHEKTFSIYGIMDVVAVPSEYEGFGLSAAEAMAAGVPVVASDVGGLREVVEHGTTGLLVPYGAAERMAEAILTLLREPVSSRKMGRAGRKKIAEQFSLSKYSSLLVAAYSQYT